MGPLIGMPLEGNLRGNKVKNWIRGAKKPQKTFQNPNLTYFHDFTKIQDKVLLAQISLEKVPYLDLILTLSDR